MSARAAERPSRPRDELAELLRLIGRLRWRLGWERLLGAVFRCLAVAVALLSAVLLVDWLLAGHVASPGLLAAIPLAVAFAAALAWARWPSAVETARIADRRLHLADRLATAVELAPALQAGADRRLDRLQLVDAVARAGTASGWPSLAATVRRDLAAALAATVFGGAVVLAVVLVPEAPRLGMSPGAGTGEAPAAPDTRPAETPAPPLPAAAPPAPLPPPAAEPQRQEVAPSDPSLAQRAQQETAQRAALDRLAQQLRQLSATASAADAISRGDYAAARTGLADLGDNADQLSDAAKRQLAQALQVAASGSTRDPQLAQREQGAARALGQPDYAAQQKALRQLGDQLAQSGSNSPSSAQVQRDVGQLQAQRDAASGATGQAPSSDSSGQSPAGLASGDQANTAGAGAGGGQGAPGGPGAGAGTGTTATMLGDPAPPLDAVGEHVEVPALLSGSTSARPAQGDAQQPDAPLGGSGAGSVAEAPRDGPTGHVAPEQNRVPGDQRGVVRGYFNGDAAR